MDTHIRQQFGKIAFPAGVHLMVPQQRKAPVRSIRPRTAKRIIKIIRYLLAIAHIIGVPQ